MKWKNKGHEFDNTYKKISEKQAFYLFGAGDYGMQFYRAFHKEINVIGYIDNSLQKQSIKINGLKCHGLKEIQLNSDTGIIVTMSQIARVEPIVQLINKGLKKDIDFFIIEEFISVYYVYKYNKVYFSSVSFLPATVCNLRCRHCLNFNPFASQFYVRGLEALIQDVDLFFSCVDHIMLFHISGGEPMLYKNISDIIEYIAENYGDKIDTLRTVTNGTVIPDKKTLEILNKCNVEVTVDDYRKAVPQYAGNFEKLIEQLEKYGIRYYINSAEKWIDLAPERTDYSDWPEEKLIGHASECNQSWQELRNGKLYSCNYAAYAAVAGLTKSEDKEAIFDLTKVKDKKELIEFRLGYTEKGYTDFCKYCRGFCKENTERVKSAIQTE